jgi:hypothetical protein
LTVLERKIDSVMPRKGNSAPVVCEVPVSLLDREKILG